MAVRALMRAEKLIGRVKRFVGTVEVGVIAGKVLSSCSSRQSGSLLGTPSSQSTKPSKFMAVAFVSSSNC